MTGILGALETHPVLAALLSDWLPLRSVNFVDSQARENISTSRSIRT